MKTQNSVKFDPGFSSCVARVSGNLEYIYSAFNSMVSVKQKRLQFGIIYPKILKIVDENIAFYLGCLLWGLYIKSFIGHKIEANPCLGAAFDDEALHEVNFLIDFVKNGLNRDVKYYLNKEYFADSSHIGILEKYKEFFTLNEGFIATKTTDDIKIPTSLKILSKEELSNIKAAIDNALEKQNIVSLMPLSTLLF